MPRTASPGPQGRKSNQELAFARAHPELATLATVQIREAMATATALENAGRDARAREAALREWATAHGIDSLPFE